MLDRVILIILDSCGCGELPDADKYGDLGANTIGNIARKLGGLDLPNLEALGLGNIIPIEGVKPQAAPTGCFGKMAELSNGKDTTTGHWEISGIILKEAFPTFPKGFPLELIQEFERKIGRKTIANEVASGTEIIARLGAEHVQTGYPIVYTSADSVFQIAAHEAVIPIDELYKMCEIAREMLVGPYKVGRVIARPFIGEPGNFTRTTNRHDYAITPPHKMILNYLQEKDLQVMAVGKIKDIYHGEGVTQHVASKSNMDGIDRTLEFMQKGDKGLIMTNLVEFDSNYGHRNDVEGYAKALKDFDQRLPELISQLGPSDLLMLTADHGCDPTTPGTDHTREYVPLLVYGKGIKQGADLGVRKSFADVGATIGEIFGIDLGVGESFIKEIRQ